MKLKNIAVFVLLISIIGFSGCNDVGVRDEENDGEKYKEQKKLVDNVNIKSNNEIVETGTQQLEHYMEINSMGMPEALKQPDSLATYKPFSELAISWIEKLKNKPIDISEFIQAYVEKYDGSILKMFKINVISSWGETEIEDDAPIIKATAVQSLMRFAGYLDGQFYKNNKDKFIGKDLKRYYEYLKVAYQKDAKNESMFIDSDVLLKHLNIAENDVITKEKYADFFVYMREASIGAKEDIEKYESVEKVVGDENANVKQLLMLNIYNTGQTGEVMPQHELTQIEFSYLLQRSLPFLNAFTKPDFSPYYITNEEVANILVAIYEGTNQFDVINKTENSVDNDVEYPWYVSQLESGKNSYQNAMPACIAMILKWENEKNNTTIEQIIKTSKVQDANWNIDDIKMMLATYSISFTEVDATTKKMVEAIDNKQILFATVDTQIPNHAVIIKGYTKKGEDIYFHIYDPAVGDFEDEYGKPMGANIVEHEAVLGCKIMRTQNPLLVIAKE